MWTYLLAEPFTQLSELGAYLDRAAASLDPIHYTVVDMETQRAVGTMALMRIDPVNGVMEVGHITYSPLLQRTRAATEAQYLLMKLAFDTLGYRRYEWKCDSLNVPSRNAAARFGFSFEGIFRQATVYKGRSRDTAWFSIVDREWLVVKAAFDTWLSSENFDSQGQQALSLARIRSDLMKKIPSEMAA
ncbi:Protein N-acetyltransferase, RimJ/RimL family [Polaromonas sp. YR568]|nr:Protein N-acetyltransferase, RimJ/RimL family [Polaromonas sp. YR568]